MFVTWFATGGHGDGGFSTHQFAKPDMRWIDAVRKSHPGCSVAYVLDQDTQLETYEGLDVHRYIDFFLNKAPICLNICTSRSAHEQKHLPICSDLHKPAH